MTGKSRIAFLFAGIAALCFAVTQVSAQSSVVDTRHNLSSTAGADPLTDHSTDEDQVCVFCHTPHQASPAAPLWNHTQSAVASYGVYTSPTLEATDITDIAAGMDVSNLCMSCHDGTVGVNDLGNPANDTGGDPTMGSGNELNASGQILASRPTNMGTSLSDDHPVNFTYDAALAASDGELATPISGSYVDAAQTVPLFASKVQCASCHDPHDNTNEPFLTKTNSGSQLCITCHLK